MQLCNQPCNNARDEIRSQMEFVSRFVSLIKILRNNFLRFIEERRGGIRTYHRCSSGFAYRGLPFTIWIRWLTVEPAIDEENGRIKKSIRIR